MQGGPVLAQEGVARPQVTDDVHRIGDHPHEGPDPEPVGALAPEVDLQPVIAVGQVVAEEPAGVGAGLGGDEHVQIAVAVVVRPGRVALIRGVLQGPRGHFHEGACPIVAEETVAAERGLVEIEIAVVVVVDERGRQGPLLERGPPGHIGEEVSPVVAEEPREGGGVRSEVDIQVPVIVVVSPGTGERVLLDPDGVGGHLGEGAVPVVPVQGADTRNRAPHGQEVRVPVAVVVPPGDAAGAESGRHSRGAGHVGEATRPVVGEQEGTVRVRRHQQVEIPVPVVVRGRDSLGIADAQGSVGREGPSSLVAKEQGGAAIPRDHEVQEIVAIEVQEEHSPDVRRHVEGRCRGLGEDPPSVVAVVPGRIPDSAHVEVGIPVPVGIPPDRGSIRDALPVHRARGHVGELGQGGSGEKEGGEEKGQAGAGRHANLRGERVPGRGPDRTDQPRRWSQEPTRGGVEGGIRQGSNPCRSVACNLRATILQPGDNPGPRLRQPPAGQGVAIPIRTTGP